MSKDKPAYPMPNFINENGCEIMGADGLTRRELFAAMAMQGWLSSWPEGDGGTPNKATAKMSVGLADALIAELDKDRQ